VPCLADQGRYICSESSFYRVLRAAHQQYRRGRSLPPHRHPMPTTHVTRKPNQVRSWGIIYLPLPVRGQHYYPYLIKDIYSRKAVGWEVHLAESGDEAATLLAKMYDLGITPPWSGRRNPGMASFAVSAGSILRTKYPLCSRWRRKSLMNCFLICS
jgi:hypothetical protein